MLWMREIYPRIHRFVPCGAAVEIAPGFGRWTARLAGLTERLWAVDLAPKCVEALQERFQGDPSVTCATNDGRTLPMIPDHALDFAFSFDSLVHADAEAVRSYVRELARILRPGGFAFLHHSNLGQFRSPVTGELTIENPHWRASDVSADLVRGWCAENGLRCLCQEKINWGGPTLTDVFSLIEANSEPVAQERFENPSFMRQAEESARIARAYAPR
jgi:SAM-dependent methyltransferase